MTEVKHACAKIIWHKRLLFQQKHVFIQNCISLPVPFQDRVDTQPWKGSIQDNEATYECTCDLMPHNSIWWEGKLIIIIYLSTNTISSCCLNPSQKRSRQGYFDNACWLLTLCVSLSILGISQYLSDLHSFQHCRNTFYSCAHKNMLIEIQDLSCLHASSGSVTAIAGSIIVPWE